MDAPDVLVVFTVPPLIPMFVAEQALLCPRIHLHHVALLDHLKLVQACLFHERWLKDALGLLLLPQLVNLLGDPLEAHSNGSFLLSFQVAVSARLSPLAVGPAFGFASEPLVNSIQRKKSEPASGGRRAGGGGACHL